MMGYKPTTKWMILLGMMVMLSACDHKESNASGMGYYYLSKDNMKEALRDAIVEAIEIIESKR